MVGFHEKELARWKRYWFKYFNLDFTKRDNSGYGEKKKQMRAQVKNFVFGADVCFAYPEGRREYLVH